MVDKYLTLISPETKNLIILKSHYSSSFVRVTKVLVCQPKVTKNYNNRYIENCATRKVKRSRLVQRK